MPPEIPSLIMPMEEEPVKPVEPVAPAVKVQHITVRFILSCFRALGLTNFVQPERSVELLQIFLPPRIDFYRQPIESPSVPVEQGTKTRAASEAASILSAAAASKPKANEPISIYGSVSTSDVAASVRAVLAENDEAARVVFSDGDIEFVGQMKSEEKDRVKHLGEFEVEIPIKGAPEAIKRIVRVMPSEAVKVS